MYFIGGIPFSRRKRLTINNNSGGSLINYQVAVTVLYSPVMKSDFGDIRFADASGTMLPYWIESKTDSSTAAVWIKVNLPNYGAGAAGDNTVYMYYGNPAAASASDGANVFIWYEDFEAYTAGATIDGVNNWAVIDSYGGGKNTTVETDQSVFPGTKSLRISISGSTTQRNDAVKTLSSTITADIITEFDFRTTKYAIHSGGGDNVQWAYAGCGQLLDGTKVAAGIGLGRSATVMQGDDFIYQQPDGTIMTTYAVDTWYKLRIVTLFSTKKSSHYINGTRYTTDVDFVDVTAAGFTKFSSWRYSYDDAYYDWVDNIRVRKYVATEPTVTTGQEEYTSKGGLLIF